MIDSMVDLVMQKQLADGDPWWSNMFHDNQCMMDDNGFTMVYDGWQWLMTNDDFFVFVVLLLHGHDCIHPS